MSVSKLLTETETAELLGVKPSTLAAWRCRKTVEVPYVKIGHRVMYAEDDLVQFIERNRCGGSS